MTGVQYDQESFGPEEARLKSGDAEVTLAAPPPQAPRVYAVGGAIKEPRRFKRVEPSYPTVAKLVVHFELK